MANSLYELITNNNLAYYIETYGCQMNVHDSEKIAGLLESIGYRKAQTPEEASFLIFNTCCVREHAESKIFGNVGVLKHRYEKEPGLVIAVCGCMMQQEETAKRFFKTFPFVKIVFGTHNMHRLPEMLYSVLMEKERVFAIEEDTDIVEDIPVSRNTPPLSYVNIMKGCDNFCSYCIVPYVRGREKSRAPELIIKEVSALAQNGYREVMLLGQNVNSYGKGTDYTFPKLLKEIAEKTGMPRIRFMTSHPKDISSELIEVMASHDTIANQLHLPLQSGSNDVLFRMNRKYTIEHYMGLIQSVREAIPNIALSTDLIVGFPGETEKDFTETLDAVKAIRFDAAYTFVYSKRKGTVAEKMDGHIEKEVKQERIGRLIDLQANLTYESNLKCVGNKEAVLVEGTSKRNEEELCGRTESGKMVNFMGEKSLIGSFVPVIITEAKRTTLFGKLLS